MDELTIDLNGLYIHQAVRLYMTLMLLNLPAYADQVYQVGVRNYGIEDFSREAESMRLEFEVCHYLK